MNQKSFAIPALVAAFLIGVSPPVKSQTEDNNQSQYQTEMKQWHQHRIDGLKKPDGWLSLAGLFWLEPGDNRFGTDPKNNIVFPKGAPSMGDYHLDSAGNITLKVAAGADLRRGTEPVTELKLDSAEKEGATVLSSGTLSWYLIQRDGRWGIRLKDSASPTLAHFSDIPTYPVDPSWRLQGHFEAYHPTRKIAVPTALGTVSHEDCPGAVVFQVQGKTYRLDAVKEEDEPRLFIIFADDTTGHGSYPAGRFLYVDPPNADGAVVIDFNRAYNPPCAFSDYATCPRPPRQNVLSLAVSAGEKSFGH
jgi:uncharacterized protein (DUF1684 family)